MKKKLSDKQKLRLFFRDALAEARTAPPVCRHFGDCGGCEFQDVPYPAQLEAKRRAFAFIAENVRDHFREKAAPERAERLERLLAGDEPAIQPSPRQLGYRQRMDYVFAFGMAGLRRAGRHRQVVDLAECPLLGEAGFAAFRRAGILAREMGIPDYDYMKHVGELRYCVVRRSRNGETLASLVSKSPAAEPIVMAILRRLVDEGVATSGHWLLAEGMGDVSFGKPLAHVGAPWIVESMNGVSLRLGPNTFFQSNPDVAEKAYAAIADFCPPGGRALDLYSGVGSIALSIAPKAGAVEAVENVPENVLLAQVNRRENAADNVLLVNDDSAAFLRRLADDPGAPRPDLVVVNPPRPGVEGDGMADLARLGPERFAYLSCNPFTLLRNLAELPEEYRLRSLTLYDMFPQTRHFETLALLERK